MLFPDNILFANILNLNDESQLKLMIQVITIILGVLFFYNNMNAQSAREKKNNYYVSIINPSSSASDRINSYTLTQNTPNPFTDSTYIRYSLPDPGKVLLEIYNDKAETIAILVDEIQNAGSYTIPFSTENGNGRLPAGIYYYRLKISNASNQKKNEFVNVKRMIIVE